MEQKDTFWRQRAKQHWLRNGDANTKYFHQYASSRRKKNYIDRLRDQNDMWLDNNSGLQAHIYNFFTDLFSSKGCNAEAIFSKVYRKISEEQNAILIRPFDPGEIKYTMFSMYPDTSPGPDGMNPGFFLGLVGKDVTKFCLQCLNEGQIPHGLNSTSLVLIPKKKSPESLTEFRPIALCNVVYKVIAKVLANRMKEVMKFVIYESQSAFIPGRLITDNIMVAFESNHYLKRKKFGRQGQTALKLDMSKAYDRIEWKFLKGMMIKLGFCVKWVHLIMMCVMSVDYTIMHNGDRVGPIFTQRGLRQGDPLSPYIFIICAEGLSALLSSYEAKGLIHGCKISLQAPIISHLFFADDSLLFFRATCCGKIR